MDAIDRDAKLAELKHLIEKQSVGSVEELANKINLSRATFFRFINHLRIREQREIKYCRKNKHFYFETIK